MKKKIPVLFILIVSMLIIFAGCSPKEKTEIIKYKYDSSNIAVLNASAEEEEYVKTFYKDIDDLFEKINIEIQNGNTMIISDEASYNTDKFTKDGDKLVFPEGSQIYGNDIDEATTTIYQRNGNIELEIKTTAIGETENEMEITCKLLFIKQAE